MLLSEAEALRTALCWFQPPSQPVSRLLPVLLKNNKWSGQLKLSMFLSAVLCLQCQLMKNGDVAVSVWENNREDGEDSATQVGRLVLFRPLEFTSLLVFDERLVFQVVILQMDRGDQAYVELMSGRKLCNQLTYNVFTGHIIYPGE